MEKTEPSPRLPIKRGVSHAPLCTNALNKRHHQPGAPHNPGNWAPHNSRMMINLPNTTWFTATVPIFKVHYSEFTKWKKQNNPHPHLCWRGSKTTTNLPPPHRHLSHLLPIKPRPPFFKPTTSEYSKRTNQQLQKSFVRKVLIWTRPSCWDIPMQSTGGSLDGQTRQRNLKSPRPGFV